VDEVLWVGSEDGMEAELVAKAGIRFHPIPAAGVHGVGLAALPGNLWKLLKGVFAARKVIKKYNTGSESNPGGIRSINHIVDCKVSSPMIDCTRGSVGANRKSNG